MSSYKNLSGFRSAISETARFPFLCKNLAVFASENPQILFLAKTICCVFLLQKHGFSYNKVRQIL